MILFCSCGPYLLKEPGSNCALLPQGFGFWAGAMEDMANIYIPTNIKEFVTRFIAENYTGVEDHLTKQWAFMVPSMIDL